MSADSFFARWSKEKKEPDPAARAIPSTLAPAPDSQRDAAPSAAPEPLPPPTIEDVADLTPQSDYTRFIGKGVDQDIQRAALKKLFTDPHFNVMDGLDIYIDDYNKFEPIPPEMLALMNHAKGLLDPLSQFEKPLMRLMENPAPPERADAIIPPATQDVMEPVSAAAEPDIPPTIEHKSTPSEPDESTPPPTLTGPDNDHKIQSM
jgi:hypothetical protein